MSEKNTAIANAIDLTARSGAGLGEFAKKMNMSRQVLTNKTSSSNQDHFLTVPQLVSLLEVSQDYRAIQVMAEQFGLIYLNVALPPGDVNTNISKDLAEMAGEFALLMNEIATDLADNVISDNEMQKIEKEAERLRIALTHLLSDLRKKNAELHQRDAKVV